MKRSPFVPLLYATAGALTGLSSAACEDYVCQDQASCELVSQGSADVGSIGSANSSSLLSESVGATLSTTSDHGEGTSPTTSNADNGWTGAGPSASVGSSTAMPSGPAPTSTGSESSEPVSPTTDVETSESPVTDDGTTSADQETTEPQPSSGSAGCGSQSPLQSGTKMVNIDGTNRQYIVDVPANYNSSNEYTLVFVWHPLGGSASQVANGYDGLKNLANNSAIFVAADGLQGSNHEVSGKGWWNANNGDMKLLTSILEEVNNNLCINQDRIFSTGFSFGGMMSYTVGFEFDVFRAIAPTSGNLDVVPHEKRNTAPLAIMAFHGATDTFVSTAGGRAARDQYISRNKCQTQTQPVNPSPCVEYQGCDVPTIWCEYNGAHAPWNQMPAAVWAFFSQFE